MTTTSPELLCKLLLQPDRKKWSDLVSFYTTGLLLVRGGDTSTGVHLTEAHARELRDALTTFLTQQHGQTVIPPSTTE